MKKRGLAFTFLSLALIATTSFSATAKNATDGGEHNPVKDEEVTVTWKYDSKDGIKSETTKVSAYQLPTAPKTADQLKFSRDGHDYTFNAWNPAITVAIPGQENTYTASFTSTASQYDITFNPDGGKWEDGSTENKVIKTDHGVIPNPGKNPTKDGYTFSGWDKAIVEATTATTYKALYKQNVDKKYTINLECVDCTVDGHKTVFKQDVLNAPQTFKFDLPSDYKVHGAPYKLDFSVTGVDEPTYTYNESTATLTFNVEGDTTITAYADNSAVGFTYDYTGGEKTIGFAYGDGEVTVDWGDGTTNSSVSSPINGEMTHTYSSGTAKTYNVRVFGNPSEFAIKKTSTVSYGEDNDNIKTVHFYHSITTIPNYGFYNAKITSIDLGEELTSIGSNVFNNASNLANISLPKSLSGVGSNAFSNCSSLKSIVIPNKVTTLGSGTFSNCSNLENVTLHDDIISIGQVCFQSCGKLKSINLPSKIKSIYPATFNGCASIKNIIVPNGVTSIDTAAFAACTSLNSVVLPYTIASIGDSAFSSCINVVVDWTSISSISQVPTKKNQVFKGCGEPRINVANVDIKERFESKWSLDDTSTDEIHANQIVAPATITLKASVGDCFYKLGDATKTPTTGSDYSNTIAKDTATALPTEITVKNGNDTLTSEDYTYNSTTGAFSITGSAITRNITVIADWKHTVNFVVGDAYIASGHTQPADIKVIHNQKATLPTLTSPFDYEGVTYTFKQWDKSADTAITADTTFTAEWTTLAYVTVTWKNYDSTVLLVEKDVYHIGDKASYPSTAPVPTKPASDQYTYTFKGWNPDPTTTVLESDTTFYAQFDETVNKYNITFDAGVGAWTKSTGKTIVLENLEYGTTAATIMSTLAAKDTIKDKVTIDSVEYTFRGWSPEVRDVDGAATYTAQYAPKTEYLVKWLNHDGTPLCDPETYQKGAKPVYTGPEPVKILTQKIIDEQSEPHYSYHKQSWNYQWLKDDDTTTPIDQMNLPAVTADTTYTAYFDPVDLEHPYNETVYIKFVGGERTIGGKSEFTDVFTYGTAEHTYILDAVFETDWFKIYKENEEGVVNKEADQGVDYTTDITTRKITFLHSYCNFRFEFIS